MSERDTLVAACVVRGLPFDGKTPVLRKRLLDYMMTDPTPVATPVATPVPDVPMSPTTTCPAPAPKPSTGANKKPKRPPSAYNLFVRDTLPAVINDGFKGKETMVEVAKRWRAQKAAPPLLLTTDESGSSTSEDTALDKLIDGLFTLDMVSLRANLAAMNHPINGTKAQLVERLAIALLG